MPYSKNNIALKNKFDIHKKIDSSFISFTPSYKNYLHKKQIADTPNFFTSEIKNEGLSNISVKSINIDWISSVLVLIFALVVFSRHYFPRRFAMLTNAFGSIRLFNQFIKDGAIFKDKISLPLFIATLLTFTLFAYQTYHFYGGYYSMSIKNEVLFLILCGFILATYLFKLTMKLTIGALFKTTNETLEHITNIYIFDIIATLLLLPIVMTLTYSPSQTLLIVAATVIGILFILRLIRLITIGLSKSKFSGYYLFLYLCSVEILPVIVFAKMAIVYFNIEF